MIVIDFAVVQLADEALINHRLRGEELRTIAALKTDTNFTFPPFQSETSFRGVLSFEEMLTN